MLLTELNGLDRDGFVACIGSVFEHSPWIAERTWSARPFSTVDALHAAMMQAVSQAADEERLALIRAHPELAGREASAGGLTADSSTEQGRLGFTSLSREEFARVAGINRRYRERFGFPCIVALALHAERSGVISEMESRVANERPQEMARALQQIGHITRARLARLVKEG